MKKLLLTTAIVGAATFAVAAPAKADIQLGLGGHFKGYMTYNDQDTATGVNARKVDILRDTELHFTGETTLDNGLTVGFHSELAADPNDFFVQGGVQESYAYFAGNWGRVNFGAEDGAAYLLQVAAPAADTNYDGIRQQVNPFNYALAPAVVGTAVGTRVNTTRIDYAQDETAYADKLTYITPVFSGFQAGFSYTPDMQGVIGSPANKNLNASAAFGTNQSNNGNSLGSAWEGSGRYEGQFNAVRVTLGGGYTHIQREADSSAVLESDKAWNLGANFGFGPFNVGGAYKQDNRGLSGDRDQKAWVFGADYTTGPFVLGASYFDEKTNDYNGGTAGAGDLSIKRYAGGVTYTYGPGMSFRGSVEHVKNNVDASGATAAADASGTSVLLGTQIGF